MKTITFTIVLFMIFLLFCSSGKSPREVTIDFVGSVLENDSLGIENALDLDAMVDRRIIEMASSDTLSKKEIRDKILSGLLDDGGTREFWMSMTPVVNTELVVRDTAEVDVTFLDKEYGKYHHYKIYLYNSDQGWRVFFFL